VQGILDELIDELILKDEGGAPGQNKSAALEEIL
jgi:hypothetical protein